MAFTGAITRFNILLTVLEKRTNGSVNITVADPNFPNKVVRFGDIPYQAVIWRAIKFDRTRYYVKEIYDYNKVVRYVYTDLNQSTEIPLDKFNAELPESLQIAQEEVHNLGFLPVIEMHRKPIWDYSQPETAASLYKFKLQAMLDETTRTVRLENQNNRTRVILDQAYVNGLAKHEQAKVAKSDIFIKIDATGKDPKEAGKAFEVIKGEPQFKSYWEHINNIFKYALEFSGYSDISDSESYNPTATSAIFTKANDLETSNDLIKYRIKDIKTILIKVMKYKNNIKADEQEISDDGLVIKINPNIIFNEMNMTNTLAIQKQNGWITDEDAISKINGISLQDAKEISNNVEVKDEKVVEVEDDLTK